ncbi:hypothetical protein WR25_00469 [Diploscapter pachys]|uniref:Uncharacterized protein n=1 Tax=Diploscapter pachys TaxID=2018661 RepID=A0A2A2KLD3_9BILA|nr:hypothetical protein WR25_00469 [Diploscapter pachys]
MCGSLCSLLPARARPRPPPAATTPLSPSAHRPSCNVNSMPPKPVANGCWWTITPTGACHAKSWRSRCSPVPMSRPALTMCTCCAWM